MTFSPHGEHNTQSLRLKENNYGKEVLIDKMTQKFELDRELPASNQIKKTEFNILLGKVFIFYHYEEGKITTRDEVWKRNDLIGNANIDSVDNKD